MEDAHHVDQACIRIETVVQRVRSGRMAPVADANLVTRPAEEGVVRHELHGALNCAHVRLGLVAIVKSLDQEGRCPRFVRLAGPQAVSDVLIKQRLQLMVAPARRAETRPPRSSR